MEFLDVVNDQDEVVGREMREKIYADVLNHRIAHVIVVNKQGQVALQLRSQQVRGFPGHWCIAACGHVQAGESYLDAAKRELKEEAGIDAEPVFVANDQFVWTIEGRNHKKFLGIFVAQSEGPFPVDPVEVDRVEFFDPAEILEMASKGEKVHLESFYILEKFINNQYVS